MFKNRFPPGGFVTRLARRAGLYYVRLTWARTFNRLKSAVIAALGRKQQLSPWRHCHCAYAALYGGPSCWAYGRQAIAQRGLVNGLVLLWQRLGDCQEAAVTIRNQARCPVPPGGESCDNPLWRPD